jgi:hypothetical protein
MRELERTDPVRYANVARNMANAAGARSLMQRQSEQRKEQGGAPGKYRDSCREQPSLSIEGLHSTGQPVLGTSPVLEPTKKFR